ncbi:Ig-like domain-containing protein [Pendulispora albinea]|uniref:Ig-like domain-containing protein n=1 Tax=Pendulispora albinea TaxID=2741071 RepID=A0ABZ2MBJ0_9BACT
MNRRTILSFLGAPLVLACLPLAGCSDADPAARDESPSQPQALVSAQVVPSATIDSPAEGEKLPVGIVRVSGRFTQAYNLKLSIAGKVIERVHTVTNGEESGTWYYDLDTRKLDGEFQLALEAYGWTPWRTVSVDNPAANVPKVTVASPADGGTVRTRTPIRVDVDARNDIASVVVRINGGPWLTAARVSPGARAYEYSWDPTPLGDAMASIEARAVDARGNLGKSFTTYVRVGNGAVEPVQSPRQDRALWLWEPGAYSIVHNPGARRVLESFAADGKVKTVYFGVDRYTGEDMLEDFRPQVRDFVSWAHGAGLKVYALIASAARPLCLGAFTRYHGAALSEYEKVLNYDLSSNPRERFDGLNVDIEPYVCGIFDTPTQVQWLEVLQRMIQRRDTAGSGHAFGPAIPFWLDGSTVTWKGQTKTLDQHMQDLNDYVAIMSYRDSGEGMLAAGEQEIAYAATIGKPGSVLLGLEASEIASSDGDPWWISYHHVGRTYMENELAKLYAAANPRPGFGGVALEHYDSMVDQPSDWSQNPSYPPYPKDYRAPSALSDRVKATAFDSQSVDLTWGRAYDDTTVNTYNIYRSEDPNFRPCADNLIGATKDLWMSDMGLLPSTRYYYRIAAVDIAGKEGPASPPATAKTTAAEVPLRPMIVDAIELSPGATPGTAAVKVRVVDKVTGAPVVAEVHGHFTKRGGLYLDMPPTDANGWTQGTSEKLTLPSGIVGFTPKRIVAKGYYWAGAYDRVHYAESDLVSTPSPGAKAQTKPIVVTYARKDN